MATHSNVFDWRIPWKWRLVVHRVTQNQTQLKRLGIARHGIHCRDIANGIGSPDKSKLIPTSCVMNGFMVEVAFDLNLEARVGFWQAEKLGDGIAGRGRCLSELFSAHVLLGLTVPDVLSDFNEL